MQTLAQTPEYRLPLLTPAQTVVSGSWAELAGIHEPGCNLGILARPVIYALLAICELLINWPLTLLLGAC